MTPCEKLGYKVGDRFLVKSDNMQPRVHRGDIVTLYNDDGTSAPFFEKDGFPHLCYGINDGELEFLGKPQTEAEKRGAKFGTMGVVKATGDRIVFNREDEMKLGHYWVCLRHGKYSTDAFKPSEIRLDHEPEYKEIPFSEATDEQRMDVGNLTGRNGEKVKEIKKFSNGSVGFTIEGSPRVFSDVSRLCIRVPA